MSSNVMGLFFFNLIKFLNKILSLNKKQNKIFPSKWLGSK